MRPLVVLWEARPRRRRLAEAAAGPADAAALDFDAGQRSRARLVRQLMLVISRALLPIPISCHPHPGEA